MAQFEVKIHDEEGTLVNHYEIVGTNEYTYEDRRIYVVKDWINCETQRISIDESELFGSLPLLILKELNA